MVNKVVDINVSRQKGQDVSPPEGGIFEVILASASPRRAQLLGQLGVAFTQRAAPIDESRMVGEAPVDYVRRMAMSKALAAPLSTSSSSPTSKLKPTPIVRPESPGVDGETQALIIASDTTVVLGDDCLGKPEDKTDFLRMMKLLSGEQHEVLTAVSVRTAQRQDTFLNSSRVWFRPLSVQEMEAYWLTGEPVDKAGGYAIQGIGAAFVARLDGSFSAVMGLPLQETAALLTDFGVQWALNPMLLTE